MPNLFFALQIDADFPGISTLFFKHIFDNFTISLKRLKASSKEPFRSKFTVESKCGNKTKIASFI